VAQDGAETQGAGQQAEEEEEEDEEEAGLLEQVWLPDFGAQMSCVLLVIDSAVPVSVCFRCFPIICGD
jgi:hypothetical protein